MDKQSRIRSRPSQSRNSASSNLNFEIEKELLAVQFGLMRLRQFVYGQSVIVESDPKPLVDLLGKLFAFSSPQVH